MIFKELKKDIDIKKSSDAYSLVSKQLIDWCGDYITSLVVKLKVGSDIYIIYAEFDSIDYEFEFIWDWYEGESAVQILDVIRLENVFDFKEEK